MSRYYTCITEDPEKIRRTEELFELYGQNDYGDEPLILKNQQRALRLIAEGVDALAYKTSGNSTLLHCAVGSLHIAAFRELVIQGADVDAMSIESTALYVATDMGNLECMRELIALGANINLGGRGGGTPLHKAASEGYIDALKLLLANDADVRAKNNEGRTSLHTAAHAGNAEAVRLLVRAGADVNARDEYGQTPLQALIATKVESYPDCMRALIQLGAKMEIRDDDGDTALAHAVHNNQTEYVDILLAAGASVWTKNESGLSPTKYSVMKRHLEVWTELLRYPPLNYEQAMHLVSVIPAENIEAIPEPRERLELLFRTLPYAPELNDLYEQCTGHKRLPQAIDLQQMRQRARSSGVGL